MKLAENFGKIWGRFGLRGKKPRNNSFSSLPCSPSDHPGVFFRQVPNSQDSVSGYKILWEIARDIAAVVGKQLFSYEIRRYTPLGDDLDPERLAFLDIILHQRDMLPPLPAGEEAKWQELSFWRWVAVEGYDGMAPQEFPIYQKQWMLGCFTRTGWEINDLEECDLVEIGCGPLGMIEYLPGKRKVGYDPLNEEYERLFYRVRSGGVKYVSELEPLCQTDRQAFDFAICFNVLDHTTQPRQLFDICMDLLKPGGRFLFQVNTVKEGETFPQEHARMHPSPLKVEEICNWLDDYSSDYRKVYCDEFSEIKEYFFMAWGHKDRAPLRRDAEDTHTPLPAHSCRDELHI